MLVAQEVFCKHVKCKWFEVFGEGWNLTQKTKNISDIF